MYVIVKIFIGRKNPISNYENKNVHYFEFHLFKTIEWSLKKYGVWMVIVIMLCADTNHSTFTTALYHTKQCLA